MEWKVRFFDYPLQFRKYEAEYMAIVKDTFLKGAYILGEDLRKFEEDFAGFVGSKYAIGVGNCTDALLLSLYASGVGAGDEVITVSHTFVATVEVVKFLGATPVFVDIADDHCMNADLVESAVTDRTKVIIPVQLNGRICTNMDKIIDIAKKYDLKIIEDSAQALGARYKGKGAGTFGISGNFSFYPAKLLGTFGDAGAVVTDNEEFAKKIRLLRNHGRGDGTDINLWGLNCRMDNLHAAVLNFKLSKLPEWIKRRRKIAAAYHKGLSLISALRLPPCPVENEEHFDVFQNYEIESENRDELLKYLRDDRGIEAVIQWGGKAVHQFELLNMSDCRLPRTEELFSKALMLPLYPELADEQVEYVIDSIRTFYNEKR